MGRISRVTSSLLCLAAITGCAHPVTYGYQYHLAEQFGGGEEPEAPPAEARQLLANARTVAFFPPDNCLNTETQADRTVIARCGVLLSKLERDAERAGYEVVSWVNLRGRGDKRPIDYAREANVDVLFEINELLPQQVKDADVRRTLTFFDRSEDGLDTELKVSSTTAERCRQWATRDQPVTAGLTSTLDIKTVSVSDGRARWHYRKTVSQSTGVDNPKVRFVGIQLPNKNGAVATGVGGGLLIVGLVLALVDNANAGTPDPVTGAPSKKVFGDSPYYLMAGGAIMAAIGIVLLATTGSSKPDPATVLCLEPHVPKDAPPDDGRVGEGPLSAHHTFTETKVADPLAKQEDKLALDRTTEFFTVVTQVHNSRSPAPPPPPPQP